MRQYTAVDAVGDAHVEAALQHHPSLATGLGVPGSDHLMDDYSPEAAGRWISEVRSTLAELDNTACVDEIDEVTVAPCVTGSAWKSRGTRPATRSATSTTSPPRSRRFAVFDIMATESADDWANLASRLGLVPGAVRSYVATLRQGMAHDRVAALRQVEACIEQATDYGRPDGFFQQLTQRAAVEESLARDLQRGARAAAAAYRELAAFLADEVAPRAPETDAVGPERYARGSRLFVGASIDLDETYAWGVESLRALRAEQQQLARELAGPGATVADAVATLDADPSQQLLGTEALRAWMQQTSDQALADLNGTHFDIAAPLLRLECCIAPTNTGAIYYTGPSEDFARPGRMWWSVPEGTDSFAKWRETTTVYHEGVPGHHLQIGQAVHNAGGLNRWRRNLFISGHGEGWALYAERLMDEFGYLDTAARFGMIDSQLLRAARVVVDLGVHLSKPAFDEYGGGTWDFDKAWALLTDTVNMDEPFLRFELVRYLGWPGQAPSYRIGQRIWEEIRDDVRRAAQARGEEFSLKDFHTSALDLGGLPLDVLRGALTR